MKIVIFGVGRMGAWLAGELSKTHELALYDRDREKVSRLAEQKGMHLLPEPAAIETFCPDLFINAVALKQIIPAFEEARPFLREGCTICDIASVKGDLPAYYSATGFRFVSVHPMFGPTFADLDALKGSNAIIIKESDEEGRLFFRRFFEGIGVTVFEYSFAEHDKMMAYSLSLPFLSSLVFAASVNRRSVPGTTFAKHMAIAEGLLSEDEHLIGEILFNQHSLSELDKITGRLEYLKHILRDRDAEELHEFLVRLRENMGMSPG